MTQHQTAVLAPQMHAVAFAESERFAVLAGRGLFHPRAVSVRLEAMLPYLPERVLVYISLVVLATDGGAGGDRTVDEDGSDADAGGTLVEVVTDASFVRTQIAFA